MARKIRDKISFLTLSLSVATSLFVGFITLAFASKVIKIEAKAKQLQIIQNESRDFEIELRKITDLSLTLEALLQATFPEGSLPMHAEKMARYKESLNRIIQIYVNKFKPLTCWIIFNPELAEGKHTISYEDFDRDGIYIREKEYSVYDFDLKDSSMLWWTQAIQNGSVWTKPYYWANWNAELISFSRAVFINQRLIACVGSDFNLTALKQRISQVKFYTTGFLALFDEDLNIIHHPVYKNKNIADVLGSESYQKFKDDLSRQTGIIYYRIDNVSKILTYYKLSNGWYLAAIVPEREIFYPVYWTTTVVGFLIAITVILAVLLSFTTSRTITRPINNLVEKIRRGSDGDLTVRAEASDIEEINELSQRFNQMIISIQQMVEQLRQSETELRFAKEKAEESDRLKSAFLANISHEIRTPINAILGFSQLLTAENVDQATKEYYFRYINTSAENLISTIENIVLYSEIQNKAIHPAKEQIDLVSVLRYIYQRSQHAMNPVNPELSISLSIPESVKELYFKTDARLLQKIFACLLSNAIKFTRKGFVTFGIHSIEKEGIIFFVQDTGVGIPNDQLQKVFEKFYKYQAYSDSYSEGVGLGLTIASELTSLLGGTLWIESEVNEGTIVYFSIS